jgi:hypothetical protein
MAHFVFGTPSPDSFVLHERLRRDLTRRGHRVTLLAGGRAETTFWRAQGGEVADLPCGSIRRRADAVRAVHALHEWLLRTRADLVLLHQRRGPVQRLLARAARRARARVVWIGEGLLPNTLQYDARGLDGDAAARRRRATDFRVVAPDVALLEASLAAALGDQRPVALPPAAVVAPPWHARCRDALAALAAGDLVGATRAFSAWRTAVRSPDERLVADATLPPAPFVAVLLQSKDDERLHLDAEDPPGSADLVAAAERTAASLGDDVRVAAILPAGAHLPRETPRVTWLPTNAAGQACATALAVVTVNDPRAAVALLAGTPVIHLGRALYGVRGIAVAATLDRLGFAVRSALRRGHPALRRRFLTWLLRHGHVWCSGEQPDHNGMLGLVRRLEASLADAAAGVALPHRIGPPWPLSASRG